MVMEQDEAKELVTSMVAALTRDEDEDFLEYLINNVGEATAALMAALAELLKESKKDERTLV